MALDAGNVVRTVVKFLLDSQFDIVNVLHFYIDTNSLATPEDGTTYIRSFLETTYGGLSSVIGTNITGNLFEFFDVTDNEHIAPLPFLDSTPFTLQSEPLPPQVSPMMFFPTPKPRVQGRLYLPPTTEAHQNSGTLSSTIVTAMTNFGVALLGDPITFSAGVMTGHYVVYNRNADTYQYPSGVVIPATTRTQRRRRRGVGS